MWDSVATGWNALPEPMRDPVALAIPFFLLLLVIEWTAARVLEHAEEVDGRTVPPRAAIRRATPGRASRWAWCRS